MSDEDQLLTWCPLCFRRRGKSRRKLREAVISDETEVEETGAETETTEAGERGQGDEVASHIQVTYFL